jgi:3-oxoacyl-[acyl-carrier-protein] synthase-3
VIRDVDSFKQKLGERTLPNFFHVIREALRKSGLTDAEIDYLAILHFKRSTHNLVLEELGLSPEQTTYLEEYGHIGQNDQIISLEEGLRSGKITDGDNIVMVGAGIGFVWAAAVVRWGRGKKS